MISLQTVFFILVIFQLKHFIVDYPLQGKYMLRKFSPDLKVWVPALTAHAGLHAYATFLISLWYLGWSWGVLVLPIIDFVIHFGMDRFKASPNYLGRFKALSSGEYQVYEHISRISSTDDSQLRAKKALKSNTYFWWSLGFDQMVHHLTDLLVAYLIIINMVVNGK